jgi:hypothetical protein
MKCGTGTFQVKVGAKTMQTPVIPDDLNPSFSSQVCQSVGAQLKLCAQQQCALERWMCVYLKGVGWDSLQK